MAMQSVQLINTHRTCKVCNTKSLDLGKDRCECGGYMYLCGFVYQPTVSPKGRKQQIQAS